MLVAQYATITSTICQSPVGIRALRPRDKTKLSMTRSVNWLISSWGDPDSRIGFASCFVRNNQSEVKNLFIQISVKRWRVSCSCWDDRKLYLCHLQQFPTLLRSRYLFPYIVLQNRLDQPHRFTNLQLGLPVVPYKIMLLTTNTNITLCFIKQFWMPRVTTQPWNSTFKLVSLTKVTTCTATWPTRFRNLPSRTGDSFFYSVAHRSHRLHVFFPLIWFLL